MDTRAIALYDLDTFFVSVERLFDSRLNGKPVLVGGTSPRSVVAGCSYEARKFGVHSAMPMQTARRLCPEAIILRGDMNKYSKYSHIVTDIIKEQAPLFEKASIDEHYIDISGLDTFYNSWKWAQNLRAKIIGETGLPISFGLSVNKCVAKIAAGEAKPNGQKYVPAEQVHDFLAPLPVRKIPLIGPKCCQTLNAMGINTVGELAAVRPSILTARFGKVGMEIFQRANGIDPRPVVPYYDEKSVSTECTFGEDVSDSAFIAHTLATMTEKLAFRLRKDNKSASVVAVKIRYADFSTHTLQQTTAYTAFDHILLDVVRSLFRKLYDRRQRIRLLGIRFGGLVAGIYSQPELFGNDSRRAKLYSSLDDIRNRYGMGAVGRASAIGDPPDYENGEAE
ncbi:MAG: DNA polymerase IV [Bacteroidales bacterium]|jgi:DNA polymerase-4|nr:DNA polymerase IV [Bacteroidales bacterium]